MVTRLTGFGLAPPLLAGNLFSADPFWQPADPVFIQFLFAAGRSILIPYQLLAVLEPFWFAAQLWYLQAR